MFNVVAAPVKLSDRFTTQLVNGLLAIQPLAALAKHQARQMMIKRAEKIGVPWRAQVAQLSQMSWQSVLEQVQSPNFNYPDYYLRSFHAYPEGNLSWQAAWEVEVAAKAVHAGIWPDAGALGDDKLRQSFQRVLNTCLPAPPQTIVDLGCSVGMSTFALQDAYPEAAITGVDLSPYFLAVAEQRSRGTPYAQITWKHAAAEATGLGDRLFDLVVIFLVFHELPQVVTQQVLQEARRLLRPGGHVAIMDMNPDSPVYAQMRPYILTLLKSTEPYLDEYFSLDLVEALRQNGFPSPQVFVNSPRHRTVVAAIG